MGTAALFDISDGFTNENSPTLPYREFYAETKRILRNIIKRKARSFDGSVIILHPTIVLGSGGNWGRVVRDSLSCGTILLPKGGAGICNPVHVDDVCHAVDQAILASSRSECSEYIISSGVTMPWRKIYQHLHYCLTEAGVKVGHIIDCEKENSFNSSWFKNIIYHLLYSLPGSWFVRIVKRITSSKTSAVRTQLVPDFNDSSVYEVTGVYRLLHMKKQIFSIDSAKTELGFSPKFCSEDKLLETLLD
jgi:nucleoside-diphosphate-sugar epimerase